MPAVAGGRLGQAKPSGAGGLRRALVAALDRCGLLKREFQRHGGLRILCYHGVCPDELVGEPWVPGYFVGASQFDRQLETAGLYGPTVRLRQALEQGSTPLPEPIPGASRVAVTFDDVPACVVAHGLPALRRHGLAASFYVATGHVESGRLFWSDVLRLLRWNPALHPQPLGTAVRRLVAEPSRHKTMPIGELRGLLEEVEAGVRRRLPPRLYETLRPLNWDEVRQLVAEGHEVGSHTVDHAILGWQERPVRRAQVLDSLAALEAQTGQKAEGLAYPNGGPGDFDPEDYDFLREAGLCYALTTRPAFAHGGDAFALPRVGIGRGHTESMFAMELCGLLDGRRQRQLGWT